MELLCISISWIIGVFSGSFLGFPIWTIILGLIPLSLFLFQPKNKNILILSTISISLLLMGNIYSHNTYASKNNNDISQYNEKGKVTIEGMVAEEPELRDKTALFRFFTKSIILEQTTVRTTGSIMVITSRYNEYHYGDILKLSGILETPQNFDNFDYKTYLANKNIYSIMKFPRIDLLERDKGLKFFAWIYKTRSQFDQNINQVLPEPHSSIAKAMFLGMSANMPHFIRQKFAQTGTSHIIAISGLHLTLIIGIIVSSSTLIFGRRHNIPMFLALIIVGVYATCTGMQPPIIRSAIMGSVFLIAEILGRQRISFPALTFAAAIMVGIWPKIINDISFQLSYLSMLGLIIIYPHLNKLLNLEPLQEQSKYTVRFLLKFSRYIISSFAVTISAVIFILPLVSYYFNIVAILGLPANILVLPAIPPIIITTSLTSITGIFSTTLSQVIGWLDWFFISYLMLIINIFSLLPLSHIELPINQAWKIWLYYGTLTLVILSITYKHKIVNIIKYIKFRMKSGMSLIAEYVIKIPSTWVISILLIPVLIIWTVLFSFPDDKLHVNILDIGQGDSILIQTPYRQNILIDGGPSPQKLKLELSEKLPFWERKIDLLIVTQPQFDHIGGLLEIIRDYKVETILYSENNDHSIIYNQLLNMIKTKKITQVKVNNNYIINLGNNLNMEILHPPPTQFKCYSDLINCNGLVLRLNYNKISFLLTADIDEEVERFLVSSRANLNSTILKVAHHGSKTSSCGEFLDIVNMKVAVISVGTNNLYNHPSPETISRLLRRISPDTLYLTSKHGTVEFITDGTRLWVKPERINN